MNKPSQLELYLRNQQNKGTSDSEGSFTLARREALLKLSSFQLPFEGAWIVKLVQAGVAHESIRSLHFTQSNKECTFQSSGRCKWTLEQIESALSDPNNSEDRGLRHLATALMAVGVGQERAFWIGLRGESEKIV